ncbi:MAG: HPr-rel-A system PqqD family peptide chaperone [Acidimicrobiales bacterium]
MTPPPPSMPERGARLLGAVLDDEEVVYDPVRREAHLLNPTASMLLARCDGRTSVADLVAELQATFGADPEVIEHDVREALADFSSRRLVGPEPSEADTAPVPRPQPQLAPASDPLVIPGTWAVVGPVVHALDSRLQVRSDDPLVGRYVEQVLAPLLTPVVHPRSRPPRMHTFDVVVGGPGPIRLLLDGDEVGATTTLDAAMSFLQWSINQLAVDEAESMVLLHASAVRAGDRVAVFPAASNSGKSTLAAGMVRSGLGYVTDEAVAIELATGAVVPYPKPLSLDPGSWALFADVEPRIADSPEPFFTNEWHVDPTALHPAALDPAEPSGAPARVTLVAFPTYVPGAITAFEPISRAEGLLLMLQNSFNLATTQRAGLAALVRIAASARVVRLTVGGLEAAVDLIRTTL